MERTSALGEDDALQLAAIATTTLEVAHDLGNLLQLTSSALRMIDRRLSATRDVEVESLIGAALAAMERAIHLGQRLLHKGERPDHDSNLVYLDKLLGDLLEIIALAAKPGIVLALRCGDDIPAIVCCRRDLENVILNLAVNACDAMPAGGCLTLGITRDVTPAGGAAVTLSVSDTGCGMSAAVAEKAFQPFFTTKADNRGTGLGLATVAAFAARHNGSAHIASTSGTGTTVTLRLPSYGSV